MINVLDIGPEHLGSHSFEIILTDASGNSKKYEISLDIKYEILTIEELQEEEEKHKNTLNGTWIP
jgi:hypothetical protein